MDNQKIKKLKARYEDVRSGLDHLQEEVLRRGIEMRPGLRRQFDEALRGLFYTMACADGRIDEREVSFYNYLFEEELSVTTFELVRAQLDRTSPVFEEDFLATVAAFASYDASITGQIPLGAPSLSGLLISAAETVGRMVMESDGEIATDEVQALKKLIFDAKQRAELVRTGSEDLMEGHREGQREYDPDAILARDVRGVQRHVCAALTELVLQAADVVKAAGMGMVDESVSSSSGATRFVVDSVRDDLERGRASADTLILSATQIRSMLATLRAVERAGDQVTSAWRALARESREHAIQVIRGLRASSDARVRMLREKHDWHDDINRLEQTLQEAWEQMNSPTDPDPNDS